MVIVLILASGAAWESSVLGLLEREPGRGRAAPLRRRPRPARGRLAPARPTPPWSRSRRRASTRPRSTTCAASRCDRWRWCPPARRRARACGPPGSASRRVRPRRPPRRAAGRPPGRRRGCRRRHVVPDPLAGEPPPPTGGGRVVAVWGPAGAPGGRRWRWPSRPSSPRAAAVRRWSTPTPTAARWPSSSASSTRSPACSPRPGSPPAGMLEARFGSVQRAVGEHLTVVTGLPRPDRWVEVRAGAVEHLLEVAAAPRRRRRRHRLQPRVRPGRRVRRRGPPRNQMTLAALGQADEVVVVGSADPVGLSRLARGLVELREVTAGAPVRVVVNRMRPPSAGPRRTSPAWSRASPGWPGCTSCPTTGRPSTGPWWPGRHARRGGRLPAGPRGRRPGRRVAPGTVPVRRGRGRPPGQAAKSR